MPPKYATEFLSFVNASPTPFHAVESAKQRLLQAGFKEIRERDPWSSSLHPGGKYLLTRNGSTIVAFAIGKKWKPGNPIAMLGAHTDSPCLRIKPVSKKQSDGFLQVGVETYGGGLWHTWFDRDLSIAGRVMVKSEGKFISKLIKIDRPLLRIPTLAIHLDRQENFSFNKETQLFPIAGLVAAELNRTSPDPDTSEKKIDESKEKDEKKDFAPLKTPSERHHPVIIDIIAEAAGVSTTSVVDFELVLYDVQKSVLGGVNNELIFSARLDNLGMSFCSVEGIIASLKADSALDSDPTIRVISLFDHEEIGSRTAQGADSNLLPAVLRRLSVIPSSTSSGASRESNSSSGSFDKLSLEEDCSTAFEQTLATSFLISADMAHSVHPNYSGKYESDHRPEMNKGVVIKINANARYATSSPGIVLLQEVASRSTSSLSKGEGVPLQLFVVRNDSSCGSTIGPMLSAAMGVRTVDLGNAQLSMHSIRETGGAYDIDYAVRLFSGYFAHYGELESKILVDGA